MMNDNILTQNRTAWNAMADEWFGVGALPFYGCLCPDEDKLHLFPDLTGAKVLEIGCGSGHSLEWCAKRGAAELWGLDIAEKRINHAGSFLCECGYLPRLFCSPMEQNPGIPFGYFDAVYSIYAIGWTVNLQRTLNLIASYLKPGGVFIFSWDHPFMHCIEVDGEKLVFSGNYYEAEPITFQKSGNMVTLYNRRLCDYINALAAAGLAVERVVEETDRDTLAREWTFSSEYYAPCKAKQFPLSIVVKARKL